MAGALKPNKKRQHAFAIIRFETDSDEHSPIEFRVRVTKVVADPHFAEQEVRRLNELNRDKGAYYFSQITRLENIPVEGQEVSAVSWTTSEPSHE